MPPEPAGSTRAMAAGLLAAAVVLLQGAVLFAIGQPPVCTCGTVKLWHGLTSSPETSQHLTDWYTVTHGLHGFGFYFLLWLVARNSPIGLRFLLALVLEAGWELIENTPFIIDRYRQSALAQGYSGDSIVNSIFDTLAMAAAFALARLLPVRATVALALALELFLAAAVRDNLTLNIVQLIWPTELVSRWQAGGQ